MEIREAYGGQSSGLLTAVLRSGGGVDGAHLTTESLGEPKATGCILHW